MDYEAVLIQVLALLQQEQRLSYRVLKRRLHLDDDLLEDLKEESYLCQKARRGRGRESPGLGRRGGGAPPTAPPPLSSPCQRRNGASFTVLFCDLVRVATALSAQLGPEACGRWCGPMTSHVHQGDRSF